MRDFNSKAAINSLIFFAIEEGGMINKMKAYKLLWLSDKLHMLKYGEPFLNDEFFAMEFGPVPSRTRDICEGNFYTLEEMQYFPKKLKPHDTDKYSIVAISKFESDWFSDSEIEVMEEVYNAFGKLDQFELSELSHSFPEWNKFEKLFEEELSKREKMELIDFFNTGDKEFEVFEKYSKNIEDMKEHFLEIEDIKSSMT